MKLDFNIITKKISEKQINEFKETIKENILVNKLTLFEKIVSSWITLVLMGVLGIAGLILAFQQAFEEVTIYICASMMGISVPSIIFIFWKRKKIIDKLTKSLNLLKIFQKWLSYYDINDEDVFVGTKDIDKEIIRNKLSPPNANIKKSSSLYCFRDKNGIITAFKMIKWHWVTRSNNSKTDNYLDQIYMFNYNFNDKWDDLNFKLKNDNRILKVKKISKNETLENNQFNKKFIYSYNEPVKLRMAFTPYTQELFVNKHIYRDISYQKDGKILVSTCESNKIHKEFTPFFYNVNYLNMSTKTIKEKIVNDVITDFIYLMKFIGHTRLIINLFK